MLDHFISTINRLLPEPHASLLAGMLFGVRATMPDDFYEALIVTGTLHVIALSGMNVSIILRVLFDMLVGVCGKYIGVLLTLISLISFIILVGPSATIVRASIMGSLAVFAALIGRKDLPLLSLFLTAVTMILINNELISSISFQLSVFATLGIILFGAKGNMSKNITEAKILKETIIEKKVLGYKNEINIIPGFMHTFGSNLLNFLKANLQVTLSAQLFTTPLILFYFNRVSFISPVANVAVGWLIAPITYLGFVAVFLAQIWWPLGRLASLVVWVPLSLFIWSVETFSQVPFASVEL